MNHAPQSITNVDEEKLVAPIRAAERRVMYLAPGVTEPVANALGEAWRRLGSDRVDAILDVDPEVCRLGYGTMAGLTALEKAAADRTDGTHRFTLKPPGSAS